MEIRISQILQDVLIDDHAAETGQDERGLLQRRDDQCLSNSWMEGTHVPKETVLYLHGYWVAVEGIQSISPSFRWLHYIYMEQPS